MLIAQTKQKLTELKLPGFIQVLEESLLNPSSLSTTEVIGLMADRELTNRQNKRLVRLLKRAKLRYPQASIENIDYQKPRSWNQQQYLSLTDCAFINQHRNLILIGATGAGKSFLACALGHQACRLFFTVCYYRVPRLLENLRIAHGDGSYTVILEQLAKTQLLILDDWGIDQLDRQGRRDLLEILEDRYKKGSTIVTTQLPIEFWADYIGDSTLSDAICDRLLGNAYQINISGESMRKESDLLTDVDHLVS